MTRPTNPPRPRPGVSLGLPKASLRHSGVSRLHSRRPDPPRVGVADVRGRLSAARAAGRPVSRQRRPTRGSPSTVPTSSPPMDARASGCSSGTPSSTRSCCCWRSWPRSPSPRATLGQGIVMSLMIVLGVGLRLIQERRADTTAAKLKAMISVTATVLRDGRASGAAGRAPGPGRHREAGGRRHDSGGRADRRRQGPVRHPGLADRRVVPGREVRGRHGSARAVAPRAGQPRVPGHERRERHRDGRRRGHRA